jgi:hypothetical protein
MEYRQQYPPQDEEKQEYLDRAHLPEIVPPARHVNQPNSIFRRYPGIALVQNMPSDVLCAV